MFHRIAVAIIFAATVLSIQEAAGAVTPVSQERYIFQSVGEVNMLESAPGFGLFSASFSAAIQDSFISSDLAYGFGTVGPDPTFGVNSATSYFKYIFDVTEPTEFSFSGSLSTGLFGSAAAHLSGPGGDIVNLTISPFESANWNESGALAPGLYTLEVFASNSIGGELSTFEFTLLVPGQGGFALLILSAISYRHRRRQTCLA